MTFGDDRQWVTARWGPETGVSMEPLKRAANRAAALLGEQETSGWKLAKLTSERVFTSKSPKVYNAERLEGRVSTREWAEAVTEAGSRWSFNTAAAYSRCWRRYGENRLLDENGDEQPFFVHLWAANERAENVTDETTAEFRADNGRSLADRKAARTGGSTTGMSYTPSTEKVMAAIQSNPDLVREIVDSDETRSALRAAMSASVQRHGNNGDPVLQELRVAVAAVKEATKLKSRHGVTNVQEETRLLVQLNDAIGDYPVKLASAV